MAFHVSILFIVILIRCRACHTPALGTCLRQEFFGLLAAFTSTEATGIPAVFFTEGNDKVILAHIASGYLLLASLELSEVLQLRVMADNGCSLSIVVPCLVLFFPFDGIPLGILNGCIVLGITKGIAAKLVIDLGFWQF